MASPEGLELTVKDEKKAIGASDAEAVPGNGVLESMDMPSLLSEMNKSQMKERNYKVLNSSGGTDTLLSKLQLDIGMGLTPEQVDQNLSLIHI